MGGGDLANEQEESGIDGEGEFRHLTQNPDPANLSPPAELTNMVAVVDTVAKDVELQQRLTSSVNQLVTNIFQTKTMPSQTLFYHL